MKLSDRLAALGYDVPAPRPFAECSVPAVVAGPDFRRVDALPRGAWYYETEWDLAMQCTSWGIDAWVGHATMHVRPIQALALIHAVKAQGLLAPIGVGQGKTLIDLLLPRFMESKCAVLCVPPNLVAQLERDAVRYAEHGFKIDRSILHVVSYSRLSTVGGAGILDELSPDLLICDEAHYLKHASSARTKRVLRYLDAHPACRACFLSGSITNRSLRDYAHLAARALGQGSPAPLSYGALLDWCGALDAVVPPGAERAPGALATWCKPGQSVRDAYRERLVQTPGVVASTDPGLSTGLEVRAYAPAKHLTKCAALVRAVERTSAWEGIDLDPLGVARLASTLALGFHYRWVWKNGVDEAWLKARNAWARAVNGWLSTHPDGREDAVLPVQLATERGATTPGMLKTLDAWKAQRNKPEPAIEAVWHNTELLSVVSNWLSASSEPGIVWYSHTATPGLLSAPGSKLPHCPPNVDPFVHAGEHVLLSIAAHGVGKNLQAWSRSLVLTPPRSGATWEQLLGRTHRPGQIADTVTYDVLAHVSRNRLAVEAALGDAQYAQETLGQAQKLVLATKVDW